MRPPTSFPFGILIGGEELHNNHHTFATSAKLSSKWYEFDIGWAYIRMPWKWWAWPRSRSRAEAEVRQEQAGSRPRHAAVGHHQPLRRDGQVRQVGQAACVPRRSRAPEAQGRAGIALPEVLAQAAAARAGQAGGAAQAAAVELFQHSKALETMHQMRVELGAIWERSHSTRDQLLQQLQDWCARAEASGIKSLQEFSLRLRSYAFQFRRVPGAPLRVRRWM
jgi:stearoyl-CoA desaturase (delta-9 desaturase)